MERRGQHLDVDFHGVRPGEDHPDRTADLAGVARGPGSVPRLRGFRKPNLESGFPGEIDQGLAQPPGVHAWESSEPSPHWPGHVQPPSRPDRRARYHGAMKIYGISQSRAMRSFWAAEECGVEYEVVPVSFGEDSKKPEYLAINPNGRVPALVDGDLTLFESLAINLYLAQKYGGALWPSSEPDQARAIQWSFWGITEFEPHVIPLVVQRLMLPEAERDAKLAAEHEEALGRPLPVLNQHLSGRPYLLGGEFTIADLNVAGTLSFAPVAGVDLSPHPEVKRWLESCTSRPAFQRARSK